MPLETVNIPGLEIFSEGTFNGDHYSVADLQAMVDAFSQVGFKPTVKAGHEDGQEDEKTARRVFGVPALGYVERIYVKGKKLLADLTQVPRRFADLIKAGAFRRISSEIYWAYKDGERKFPRVLKSVAFLGAEIPSLTNLKEIEALYGNRGPVLAYDGNGHEFRVYEIKSEEEKNMDNANVVTNYFNRIGDRAASEEMHQTVLKYQNAHEGVSYSDAMHAVVRDASNYDAAGEMSSIVKLIEGAAGASGEKVDKLQTVIEVLNMHPDLARKIASDALAHFARIEFNKEQLPGLISQHWPEMTRRAIKNHPAVAAMWNTGRVSEEALREIFPSWFPKEV
ncbi:MAG: hypothetical protein HY695_13470 [Deltaproteobacteria bacterium]|nr:hypothetical protein [Deltaproteobacteria bacterium]